jgi:3-hydroxyacyl-CoA dehydrogenase
MNIADIKKIAVLGAGTMGPGIAISYAMGGYEISLFNYLDTEMLDRAKQTIDACFEFFVEQGKISAAEAKVMQEKISYTIDLDEALAGADYVQETIVENAEIKKSMYAQLDAKLPQGVIIVSNTSALNPFELMPERRLANFAAAHWFAPPHILPLVEVAKGDKTSEETMSVVIELLESCGKTPVRLEKFVPGYIINRLQILLNTEVFYLLDNEVCTPEQLDLAVKASLMPRGLLLGLVQRYDFTGLDISARNIINGSYQMPETPERPKALFDHVDKGELGVKTGKGFYDYEGRDPVEVSKRRDELLYKIFDLTKDVVKEKI